MNTINLKYIVPGDNFKLAGDASCQVKNKLKKLSILWINMTKVIWRMHNFPVVGERVEACLIDKKYRVW